LAQSQDAMVLQRRARRRLVGAIAIALFVVIAIPIVFDREPRAITQDLVIEIPSQDAKMKPLAPPPAPARQTEPPPAPTPEPAKKAETKAPEAAPAEPAKKAEAKSTEAKPAPPAEADARRAQAILEAPAFVVPLGAFSNANKAKEVQARAAASGFKAFSETVKGAKGELRAVRAGPFATREAAEQAREKLKSQGYTVGAVVSREQP
jgi:DedD protein